MRRAPILAAVAFVCGCEAAAALDEDVASPYFDLERLQVGQIVHVETGRVLSKQELWHYLSYFPVVYVSETHDGPMHHQVQREVLEALAARGEDRVAIGMEMLRQPAQPRVDAYLAGQLDEEAFVDLWRENWGHSLRYYRGIIDLAKERKLPLLALNAPTELQQAVMSRELDELPPDLAAKLPEMELSDPHHRAYVNAVFEAHAHGRGDPKAFYRTQVLWDEAMAERAAAFLRERNARDSQLVILAGSFHVEHGFGIPRRLFRRIPVPYAIVAPYTVEVAEEKRERLMNVTAPVLPLPVADIVWGVRYGGDAKIDRSD